MFVTAVCRKRMGIVMNNMEHVMDIWVAYTWAVAYAYSSMHLTRLLNSECSENRTHKSRDAFLKVELVLPWHGVLKTWNETLINTVRPFAMAKHVRRASVYIEKTIKNRSDWGKNACSVSILIFYSLATRARGTRMNEIASLLQKYCFCNLYGSQNLCFCS